MSNLFFFPVSLWNQKNFLSSCFWPHFKITLAASTLWQNSCKTRLPPKNICVRVYSYYNSNFKIHEGKMKIQFKVMCIYSQKFSYSSSGCSSLMLWYCFLNDMSVRNTFLTCERRKQLDSLTSEITWYKICWRHTSILIYPLCDFNFKNSNKKRFI